MYIYMAVTKCAYGCYEPLMPPAPAPAPAPAVVGPSPPARSSRVMEPLNDDGRHAVVIQPSPPHPSLLLDLHLGARNDLCSSKVTYRPIGLCTEGLGSESSESSGDGALGSVVDTDDTDKDVGVDARQALHHCKTQHCDSDEQMAMPMPTRTRGRRAFPPPISVIGAAGKPWQYLRAHRGDGRLVLQEVRIPSRELLQACREDGRLMLHFAHSDE